MHIPCMHGGRRGESLPSWRRTLVCHSIGSKWYHFRTDTPLRDTCTPYVHEGNEDCMQAHQLSWQCWDERTSSSDSPPAWTCQSPSSSHVRGSSQLLGHFPCNHIHPTHTHICSSHQCVNLINILNEQSFQKDYIQLWLCAIAQHYSVCHPLVRIGWTICKTSTCWDETMNQTSTSLAWKSSISYEGSS